VISAHMTAWTSIQQTDCMKLYYLSYAFEDRWGLILNRHSVAFEDTMKLATRNNGTPDGELVVVSRSADRCLVPGSTYPNLQSAIDDWAAAEPVLRELDRRLKTDEAAGPRAVQWLDGSVYPSHSALMDKALGISPDKVVGRPMMYQGVSDTFYSPTEDIPFLSEDQFIDFEGEFGIIVDEVPAGTEAAKASQHIKLLVQINDWSLRALAGIEMSTGFGWIQAKPPCSVAPFAVTPDELGEAWQDHQVHLHLKVHWNENQFGNAFGGAMEFGFDELVAHAAMTRKLAAGTIIGSGTVSNETYREVGSSCIAERRGIEIVDHGAAKTGFMKFGDRVRMESTMPDGSPLFGAIDQKVSKLDPPT